MLKIYKCTRKQGDYECTAAVIATDEEEAIDLLSWDADEVIRVALIGGTSTMSAQVICEESL